MADQAAPEDLRDLKEERWTLLEHINTLTDKPMIALSFVWLLLLIVGVTTGLDPFLKAVT